MVMTPQTPPREAAGAVIVPMAASRKETAVMIIWWGQCIPREPPAIFRRPAHWTAELQLGIVSLTVGTRRSLLGSRVLRVDHASSLRALTCPWYSRRMAPWFGA